MLALPLAPGCPGIPKSKAEGNFKLLTAVESIATSRLINNKDAVFAPLMVESYLVVL